MQDYKKLQVWEKSHELVLGIYKVTKDFPKEELYGIISQIRRAAVSVPNNIAEGSVKGNPEFKRFLLISLGSASEVDYLLYLSKDLGYISEEIFRNFDEKIQVVKKMLTALIQKIENNNH